MRQVVLASLSAILRLAIIVCADSTSAQSIFTYAGGGSDDGRPATVASLSSAHAIAIDALGNLYVVDRDRFRVRRVSAATTQLETVAGNGTLGHGGDGGPATRASLGLVGGITLDASGNLFIADTSNNRIRRVDVLTGVITNFAGVSDGERGFAGDGGPATLARLSAPNDLSFDRHGNLFFVDSLNHRIRRIAAASPNVIATVAGSGELGSTGDGGPATLASFVLTDSELTGIAVDGDGNVFIADPGASRIRRISSETGMISTVAGSGIDGFEGDGGPATAAAFRGPSGIALASNGDLYVADYVNRRVRRVSAESGTISTVAGNGGDYSGDGAPATRAGITHPSALAFDASDNLLVAEFAAVRRIDASSTRISTMAGNGTTLLPDEPGPAVAAGVARPIGLALSATGDLYIAESGTSRIRRVPASSRSIETIASNLFASALAFAPSGELCAAEPRDNRVQCIELSSGAIRTVTGADEQSPGFSGDDGPAELALLSEPQGLAFDATGNLFIADSANHRVRMVSVTTGIISTIAGNGIAALAGDGGPATKASLQWPWSIAVDSNGNVIVADFLNNRVRRIDRQRDSIESIATTFGLPRGVARDTDGSILVATGGGLIQRIASGTAALTTVAGSEEGASDSAGDGGPATLAHLSSPYDVAVAPNGDMFIAERGADRIRVVPACVSVGAVDPISPSDGSSGVSRSPRLAWNTPPGAMRYDVVLDVSNPPSALSVSDLTTTSYSPANLEPLTTYYWRIIAKGDPFCTPSSAEQSEVRSFTTSATCSAPGSFSGNP